MAESTWWKFYESKFGDTLAVQKFRYEYVQRLNLFNTSTYLQLWQPIEILVSENLLTLKLFDDLAGYVHDKSALDDNSTVAVKNAAMLSIMGLPEDQAEIAAEVSPSGLKSILPFGLWDFKPGTFILNPTNKDLGEIADRGPFLLDKPEAIVENIPVPKLNHQAQSQALSEMASFIEAIPYLDKIAPDMRETEAAIWWFGEYPKIVGDKTPKEIEEITDTYSRQLPPLFRKITHSMRSDGNTTQCPGSRILRLPFFPWIFHFLRP